MFPVPKQKPSVPWDGGRSVVPPIFPRLKVGASSAANGCLRGRLLPHPRPPLPCAGERRVRIRRPARGWFSLGRGPACSQKGARLSFALPQLLVPIFAFGDILALPNHLD